MGTTFTHTFLYELVTLFVILDPVATIPVFLASTAGLARKDSLKVAAYAVSIAFLVLLFFIAAGQLLLEALHIPMPSFQCAGSIVLLLFGLKLVLGKITEEAAAIPSGTSLYERSIYPLAIPGIAGPGAMSRRWWSSSSWMPSCRASAAPCACCSSTSAALPP